MRCFGRAFDAVLAAAFGAVFLAAETRPFDLMVLRAADLAALLSPVHFFRTAVLAAGLDAAFCLAIACLPSFDGTRLAQVALRRVGKGATAPCPRTDLGFGSMQPVDAVDGTQLGGLDQLGMRDGH